jgi:hypothetical protein
LKKVKYKYKEPSSDQKTALLNLVLLKIKEDTMRRFCSLEEIRQLFDRWEVALVVVDNSGRSDKYLLYGVVASDNVDDLLCLKTGAMILYNISEEEFNDRIIYSVKH